MKKILFSAFLSIALIFIAGSFAEATAQTFSGSVSKAKRGTTTKGYIVMNLPNGIHANSSNPNSEYLIPTRIKLSANGVKLGNIVYPKGKNRKFSFSEDAVNVYEGRTVFSFNTVIPSNYKGSTIKINATISYQACTDEVCYPPKSKNVTITARVR